MAGVHGERLAWLALLPIGATGLFYLLPACWQETAVVVFAPQGVAYACLILWARSNDHPLKRLGLDPATIVVSLRTGILVGLLLGAVNTAVILSIVPALGADIQFLRDTPHARLPAAIMVPWFIGLIAVFVEVNFRGFLLGRLLMLLQQAPLPGPVTVAAAIALSALAFSFDPFMVSTFRHLHWIAVWDGLVWGMMWVRLRSLTATIAAHAVEVFVMYGVLKLVLT